MVVILLISSSQIVVLANFSVLKDFIKMSFIISWIEKMNILYIEERKFEEDRKNTDERSNRRYFAE